MSESQDKSLKRIQELKEKIESDQVAKRDLEAQHIMKITEKEEIIRALNLKEANLNQENENMRKNFDEIKANMENDIKIMTEKFETDMKALKFESVAEKKSLIEKFEANEAKFISEKDNQFEVEREVNKRALAEMAYAHQTEIQRINNEWEKRIESEKEFLQSQLRKAQEELKPLQQKLYDNSIEFTNMMDKINGETNQRYSQLKRKIVNFESTTLDNENHYLEPTEIDYLRQIVYAYMMGTDPIVIFFFNLIFLFNKIVYFIFS